MITTLRVAAALASMFVIGAIIGAVQSARMALDCLALRSGCDDRRIKAGCACWQAGRCPERA